jgi:hypothetical protein
MKIRSIMFMVILIFAVVSPAASATVLFEDDFNDGDLDVRMRKYNMLQARFCALKCALW